MYTQRGTTIRKTALWPKTVSRQKDFGSYISESSFNSFELNVRENKGVSELKWRVLSKKLQDAGVLLHIFRITSEVARWIWEDQRM